MGGRSGEFPVGKAARPALNFERISPGMSLAKLQMSGDSRAAAPWHHCCSLLSLAMTPDPYPCAPSPLRRGSRHGRAGLTLVEVMVAAAMIGLTCTTFMFAFTQLNQMAMVARLYTGAGSVAQAQIDLIYTDTPFQPQSNLIPAELTPGTVTANVTVYHDPISGLTIPATMTTVVAAVNASYTYGSTTDTLYLYQATVTVTYSYRNRNYSVSYSTLRTADV